MWPTSVFYPKNVANKCVLKKKNRNVQKFDLGKFCPKKSSKTRGRVLAKKAKFCTQKMKSAYIYMYV